MRTDTAPLDCGHPVRPEDVTYYTAGARVTVGGTAVTMTGTEVLFPGIARDADGRTVCYPCADSAQAAAIETADAITLYDSGPEDRAGRWPSEPAAWRGTVQTWTGGVLARVIARSTYRNGLTGTRMTALTVRTVGGRILYGRYGSDWSQAVTLRPSRARSRA